MITVLYFINLSRKVLSKFGERINLLSLVNFPKIFNACTKPFHNVVLILKFYQTKAFDQVPNGNSWSNG